MARVVVDAALGGDLQAAGLILSRVAPAIKAQAERVTFTFDAKADQIAQVEAVIQAIADGQVSADTGKLIMEAIAALSGVRQVEDLRVRIEALEQRA